MMKTSNSRRFRPTIRSLVMAFALAGAAAAATAAPALADEWRHDGDGRGFAERHDRDDFRRDRDRDDFRRDQDRDHFAWRDRDDYAPVYGYVARPPVVYAPPAFNVVVPLTIR